MFMLLHLKWSVLHPGILAEIYELEHTSVELGNSLFHFMGTEYLNYLFLQSPKKYVNLY